jgi:hypothetical protein
MNSVRAFPAIYQIRWAPGARTVSHYRNSANVVYWKSCTMSEFDWRSADTYLKLQAARATDLAWEFFRRNDGLRKELLLATKRREV